jgi:DNA-binding XRE family transcriptional regulator
MPVKPASRPKIRKRKMVRADRAIARPAHRPTKWREDNFTICASMARLGMTRWEIARALGIRRETLWDWERKNPEFSNVLKAASAAADERVEASIYERAVGYSYHMEKLFSWRGEVVRAETVEHVPPDPQLAMFWLKNRAPERWKDRMEIQHAHIYNFVGMLPSEEEWLARYAPNEPIDIKSNLPAIEDKSDDDEGQG